jgi:hypothetical protein
MYIILYLVSDQQRWLKEVDASIGVGIGRRRDNFELPRHPSEAKTASGSGLSNPKEPVIDGKVEVTTTTKRIASILTHIQYMKVHKSYISPPLFNFNN